MHDINHKHNYHNRTRHAAKQFNTMEKDCSCKGVAVEAPYKCPPGIEAANARAVASSLIERPVGSAKFGTTYGTTNLIKSILRILLNGNQPKIKMSKTKMKKCQI